MDFWYLIFHGSALVLYLLQPSNYTSSNDVFVEVFFKVLFCVEIFSILICVIFICVCEVCSCICAFHTLDLYISYFVFVPPWLLLFSASRDPRGQYELSLNPNNPLHSCHRLHHHHHHSHDFCRLKKNSCHNLSHSLPLPAMRDWI